MSTLDNDKIMNIMASFKKGDTDGDGSLSKQELADLMYSISSNQPVEEVDKEVDMIMEACDRDKSGQISYAEFFSAQKKHDFNPMVEAAMTKLSQFMSMEEPEKRQVIELNNANFNRMRQEKEEAIQREHKENQERDEEEARRRDRLRSPVVTSIIRSPTKRDADVPNQQNEDSSKNSKTGEHKENNETGEGVNNRTSTESVESQRNIELSKQIHDANTQIAELRTILAKKDASLAQLEQDLKQKLQQTADTTTTIENLQRELNETKKARDAFSNKNDILQQENKVLNATGEQLLGQIKNLGHQMDNLQIELDLARQVTKDQDSQDEDNLRLANSELETKNAKLKEEIIQLKDNNSKATKKLHDELSASSKSEEMAKQRLVVLEANLTDLRNQYNSTTAELHSVKKENQELQSFKRERETLVLDIQSLKQENQAIVGELQDLKDENHTVSHNLRILKQENQTLKQENQAALQARIAVNEQLEQEQIRAKEITTANEELKKKVLDSEKTLNAHYNDTESRIAAADARTTTQVKRAEAALEEKDGDLERMRETLAETQKQLKQFRIRHSAELSVDDLKTAEKDELIAELAKTKEQFHTYKQSRQYFKWGYGLWIVILCVFSMYAGRLERTSAGLYPH